MVNLRIADADVQDVSAVIFDKDGTLIDLYHYWSQMIGLRAALLCDKCGLAQDVHKRSLMYVMGVDVKNKRIRPQGPVGILPRQVVQKAAEDYLTSQGRENVTDICFEAFKEVDRSSESILHQMIEFIPGALSLLENLQKHHCRVAIATTDKTERARLAVAHLGINDLIDSVIGADAVEHSKPAPDMIRCIEKQLDIPARQMVMVGDAKTDIQMGINAGCKASFAVLTGLTPPDELETLTSYVADSVKDIRIAGQPIFNDQKD
jgi:HAD superfamily hydrolase (TIGR01549 family)